MLDKACFQHDMAYGNFENLPRRAAADKVLCYEAFYIAKNPKHDGYQKVLTSVAFKSFNKMSSGSCAKSKVIPNEELDKELHKLIIRNFVKWKVYSRFKNNIWGANLADMQLISKFDQGIWIWLCVIEIYSKHAWVVRLTGKKGIIVTRLFQKILDESGCKSNKIWVLKDNGFHKRSMKSWFQDIDIEMYSKHNEGKFVVTETPWKIIFRIKWL